MVIKLFMHVLSLLVLAMDSFVSPVEVRLAGDDFFAVTKVYIHETALVLTSTCKRAASVGSRRIIPLSQQ